MLTNKQRKEIGVTLKKIDRREFAARMKMSKGMAAKILTGHAIVSALRAIEIDAEFEGEISKAVLRPDIFGKV